ncbi:MAG TPA: hypothetical protein VF351_01995 [Actinomycetota bacterium]
MQRRSLARLAVVPLAALLLASCGGTIEDEYVIEEQPYTLEEIENSEVVKVTLIDSAVERLGIETAPVEVRGSRLVVPYDAVYLDAHGQFWVYTNPEPRVYIREPIHIVRETSTEAILRKGPVAGTQVVTVGVPELYGTEIEFGT